MNEQQRPLSYPLLLATVALGGILAPINSTMLAIALPEIRDEFDISHGAIAWLVSSYLIAMAVAQPIGGRVGDQIGRGRVFRGGLIAFLVLSLGAAVAPSFEALMVLRTGQALVGAAVIPNGMAMLRESAPEDKLGQSSGYVGSAISISAAIGPLLGAALLGAGSWRWLFVLNVPLVLAALACHAALALPSRPTARFSIDWLGALAFAAFLAAMTFLLGQLNGGSQTYVIAIGVAALVGFGAFFVYRQFNSPAPITEWSFFRNRTYSAATGYVLLSNLVMYTTLLAIPFFVREVQGKGSATSGTLIGMMALLMFLLSPVAGRLSDAIGRRLPAIIGSAILTGGAVAMLLGISEDVSFIYLAATLMTLGLGLGLSISAASTAAIESAPRDAAGVAAGTNSMMRYAGSIIGAGVLGSVLSSGDSGVPDADVFRAMFAIVAFMALLAFVSTLFIEPFPSRDQKPLRVESAPDRAASLTHP